MDEKRGRLGVANVLLMAESKEACFDDETPTSESEMNENENEMNENKNEMSTNEDKMNANENEMRQNEMYVSEVAYLDDDDDGPMMRAVREARCAVTAGRGKVHRVVQWMNDDAVLHDGERAARTLTGDFAPEKASSFGLEKASSFGLEKARRRRRTRDVSLCGG
ncbi:putative CCR4-NOT transcription complex subunit 1 [Phytophthora cinnamomi]|uniref:putative CCR4-NOT transcription complex subunit 1 n=1 Tax=Phytophthora cinnamomi TaxID=4785 RepID=UPI00355A7208|nr:putative CCR4-NOT transcription complex subunit 1 [Phytophthora cinnamomi]